MKVIAFESILATPHTETLLELSVLHSLAGDEVIYVPAYRFVGSSPWNSPINGDARLPRTLEAWDQYIVHLIDPFANIWVPEFVYQQFPHDWLDGSLLDAYVETATTVFYGVKGSDTVTADIARHRTAEVASTAILTLQILQVMINQLQPDLVYCFNGRTPSSWPLHHVSKRIGLSCIFHERGSTMSKYALFTKSPAYNSAWRDLYRQHRANRDFSIAKINAAYFYRIQASGKLKNFGYLDRNFEDSLPSFLSEDEQFVVFFCSSNVEIDTVPDQDVFFESLPNQIECIKLVKVVCKSLGLKLVIRTHPIGLDDISDVMSLDNGIDCFVIPPESKISSYLLGSRATARFSTGSTIGFEMIYRGHDCGLMVRTTVSGEDGLSTTIDEDSVRDFILKAGQVADAQNFIHFLGDFLLNYGHDYLLYTATSLHSGHIDLSKIK